MVISNNEVNFRFIRCKELVLFVCFFRLRRLLFVTEISFLGLYEIDWKIEYEELKEEPVIKPNLNQIQILTKVNFYFRQKVKRKKKTESFISSRTQNELDLYDQLNPTVKWLNIETYSKLR